MKRHSYCLRTVLVLGILWLGVSCGNASGAANDANPSDAGGGNVTSDGNTHFVIPPTNTDAPGATAAISPPTASNFTAGDAQTYQFANQPGVAGIDATILINSTPNACSDANANYYHLGEVQLNISLVDLFDATMATNTYVFPAGADAAYEIGSATYAVLDANCFYNSLNLVSGTVTLTEVLPTSMTGNYNLTFSTGTVSGTFSTAPTCNALTVPSPAAPSCN